MSWLSIDCPHCQTRNAGAESAGEFKWPNHLRRYSVLFVCRVCTHSVVAEVDRLAGTGSPHAYGLGINSSNEFVVRVIYPEQRIFTPPAYVSDLVAEALRQADHNLLAGNWDSSGMASRRAIDLATKEMAIASTDPAFKRAMLHDRINLLVKNGLLVETMGRWAHAIRSLGTNANHEDMPFTQEAAEDILVFTQLFLTYCFTLPGRIAERYPQKQP